LSSSNWSLKKAIDAYFNSGASTKVDSTTVKLSSKELNQVFEIYKGKTIPILLWLSHLIQKVDPDEDAICVEGMEKLCQDLEVEPTDISVLILAHLMNASKMCVFTRKEWALGWSSLG
jgi:hypothetical protein